MQGPWQDLYFLVAGCAAQQNIHLKAFSTFPCRLANSFPFRIMTMSRQDQEQRFYLKSQAIQICCECT